VRDLRFAFERLHRKDLNRAKTPHKCLERVGALAPTFKTRKIGALAGVQRPQSIDAMACREEATLKLDGPKAEIEKPPRE
jgi:hypothetical protein